MKRFWNGLLAVAAKEALHAVRDRLTLALLLTVPITQLLLFGYAIDLHPKALPTALVASADDAFVQRAVRELEDISYFHVVARTDDPAVADLWLAQSRVQFVLQLPPDFSWQIVSRAQPTIRLIADATDPVASLVATQAAAARYATASGEHAAPVQLAIERRYNPQGSSRMFVVPGLLGVVLTLTLVLLGALSLVRERERGTYEMLTLLPVPRSAVLIGKFAPYFVLGVLLFVILVVGCTPLLGLPWRGFSLALAVTAAAFIAANLALGMLLSLIARNQMQAMQLGIFFYLPSMLLSGFMFPFFGMPAWAQAIGEMLPLTHFLRVVRGVLLKGLTGSEVWPLAWPIAVFGLVAGAAAALLVRRID